MEKNHQRFFENKKGIAFWNNIYKQQDFYGDCFRQRSDIALSWVNGLSLLKDSMILDAGCGTGGVTTHLIHEERKVVGMDFSYGMLQEAKNSSGVKNNYEVAFLAGDIESLPVENASVDVVISLGVVSYLSSEEKSLREFARILKPGGILIISIVNKARLVHYLDLPLLLLRVVSRIRKKGVLSPQMSTDNQVTPHLTTYFIPKFWKSLEMTDFTVSEYKTIPYELLTFWGRELLPRSLNTKISVFFERFSNVPFVQSFGGMCVFKAKKLILR